MHANEFIMISPHFLSQVKSAKKTYIQQKTTTTQSDKSYLLKHDGLYIFMAHLRKSYKLSHLKGFLTRQSIQKNIKPYAKRLASLLLTYAKAKYQKYIGEVERTWRAGKKEKARWKNIYSSCEIRVLVPLKCKAPKFNGPIVGGRRCMDVLH